MRLCVHIVRRQGEGSLNYVGPHSLLFCSVQSVRKTAYIPLVLKMKDCLLSFQNRCSSGLGVVSCEAHAKSKSVHIIKSRRRKNDSKRVLCHTRHEGFLNVYHSEGCLHVTTFARCLQPLNLLDLCPGNMQESVVTRQMWNLPCSARTFAKLKSQLLALFMLNLLSFF